MTSLPITRMTLYKHGVGFFERRVELSGEEVELSFHVEAMNDVLKSLTAIDRGEGRFWVSTMQRPGVARSDWLPAPFAWITNEVFGICWWGCGGDASS